MSDQSGKVLSFGPFELSIGNRLLTNGSKVVPLGARAMDLLIVLVEQANKVVGRRTLIERVIRTNFGNQLSSTDEAKLPVLATQTVAYAIGCCVRFI
jgi:DNA-binding winged helix-turn-helix (wHTH) protein